MIAESVSICLFSLLWKINLGLCIYNWRYFYSHPSGLRFVLQRSSAQQRIPSDSILHWCKKEFNSGNVGSVYSER